MANEYLTYGAQGTLTGASSGAAIGSIVPGVGTAIGAGVGAVAGLGVGLVSGHQAKKALEDEEARQAALEEELAQVDHMQQIGAAVGSAAALQSRNARTTTEQEGLRLGLTGPQLAEYTQNQMANIEGSRMRALADVLPKALQLDIEERNRLVGQELAQQQLVDSSLAAAGDPLAAFGQAAAAATTAAMIYEGTGTAGADPTTSLIDTETPAFGASFAEGVSGSSAYVGSSSPYTLYGDQTALAQSLTSTPTPASSVQMQAGTEQILPSSARSGDAITYKRTMGADNSWSYEFQNKDSTAWNTLNKGGIDVVTPNFETEFPSQVGAAMGEPAAFGNVPGYNPWEL